MCTLPAGHLSQLMATTFFFKADDFSEDEVALNGVDSKWVFAISRARGQSGVEWVSGIHRATTNDVSEELKYISVHLFKREREKKGGEWLT